MKYQPGDPPACKDNPNKEMKEYAIFSVKSRDGVGLSILIEPTGAHISLLRVNGCRWLFCHICTPPSVKIMALGVVVWDSASLDGHATGVDNVVFPAFLCMGIMMRIITMMLVRISKDWVIMLDDNLLRRRVMISGIVWHG